jgi:hypothetical protein
MNPHVLPSFNSHAIESNLHRISGLSEHFLYFNDDFILRDFIRKTDFFSRDGYQSKCFFSTQAFLPASKNLARIAVDIAGLNNLELLNRHYGYQSNQKFKHIPAAVLKSVLSDLESNHPEVFTQTSENRIRSDSDYSIISSLVHHYGICKGRTIPSDLKYLYISMDDKLFEIKLFILAFIRYKTFCINDVELDFEKYKRNTTLFKEKMDLLYPCLSKYETPYGN